MTHRLSLRFIVLVAALFVFGGAAYAKGPAIGSATTTSEVEMSATVQTAVQLNISTGAGGRPNVGQLLRQTKFGENVNFEVVEYLCEELFGERNPVLHGREPSYGSHRKAAALLFVVGTLERQITKAIKGQVGKDLIQRFGDSTVPEEPEEDT